MKGLVLGDFFGVQGGAERVLSSLFELFPDWEHKVLLANRRLNSTCKCYFNWSDNSLLRLFKIIFLLIVRPRQRGFDKVIVSGIYSLLLLRKSDFRDVKLIYYCHTPPRFISDLELIYERRVPMTFRKVYRKLVLYFKGIYESSLNRCDVIIVNSLNTKHRLEKYFHFNGTVLVVNPPVNTGSFKWLSPGDYYISLARLEKYKRVDLILKAFSRMPNKKLVVLSGGSCFSNYVSSYGACSNIKFVGSCSDRELAKYLGNSIASLYISINEDFGISPVESMAAGKPVIASKSGGLLETVIEGQTGLFVSSNPSVDELIDAVNYITPERAMLMKKDCLARAGNYSNDVFSSKIRSIVDAFD